MKNIKLFCFFINLFFFMQPKQDSVQEFAQFIKTKPQTYGVTCVTKQRDGSYEPFQKFFDIAVSIECPSFTELLVIWNNEQSPENVIFLNKEKWKRNVIFHKTPYNSFNWRYEIPSQAQQQIYLSIDDEFVISCDFLEKSLELIQYHSIGKIGSVIGMENRDIDFKYNYSKPEIFVQGGNNQYFSYLLSGCLWIYKKQFDMYTLPNHKALQHIRKVVNQTINCDDLAFSEIVAYFYPETKFIYFGSKLEYRTGFSTLWHKKSIRNYRRTCFTTLSESFGFKPVPRMSLRNSTLITLSIIDRYILYVRQKYYSIILKSEKDKMRHQIQIGDNIQGKGPQEIISPTYNEFDDALLRFIGIQLINSSKELIKQYQKFYDLPQPFLILLSIGFSMGLIAEGRANLKTIYRQKKLQDQEKQSVRKEENDLLIGHE